MKDSTAALKCDRCGKFIPWEDFPDKAYRELDEPDSHLSKESYITYCAVCFKAIFHQKPISQEKP